MFSDRQIQQLTELFVKEFGMEISPEETSKHATQFLDVLMITYKEDKILPQKRREPQSRSGRHHT